MAYQNTTLRSKKNNITLDELQLNKEVRAKINQLLEEFIYKDALGKLNIPVDNKILLHGHTGCGKTATANALGIALNKKVITINLSGFVSSKLGETAKNLAELFKEAAIDEAILFIDEFDFVGKLRDYDEKDSGEMKRLVNALIQQIDYLSDNTLLICATNHINIIDTALLRRFQIKLNYELPTPDSLDSYYDSILSKFPANVNTIVRSYGISYAEAKDIMHQQIKANVIQFEKEKKHLLFSYKEDDLLKLDGNASHGSKDTLSGYKLNEQIVAIKTKDKNDKIEGLLLEITGEQLFKTDKHEGLKCRRILEITDLGTEVWLYVSNNSL